MLRTILSVAFVIAATFTAYAQTKTLTFCAYDYMTNCSDYPVSSAAARKCMADVGIDLSPKCVQAMVDDGFVTKEQVIDYAAKKGITVVDGPNGLEKVTKTPEIVVAKDAEDLGVILPPEKKEEVKTEAKVEDKDFVEKTYAETKKTIKTAAKKVTTAVKKTYTSVKTKAKAYVKSNKDYAAKDNIQEQNKLRAQETRDGFIVSEGINADFGRYTPREKGYTRNRFKYDFKKHIEENTNGINRTAGVNAQF